MGKSLPRGFESLLLRCTGPRVSGKITLLGDARRPPACRCLPAPPDIPATDCGEPAPPPGGFRISGAVFYECVDVETYAATSWICFALSAALERGIGPPPFSTWWTIVVGRGFSWSRFGPTVPVELAAFSVWQPPQPALAKTRLPAVGSPARAGVVAVVVVAGRSSSSSSPRRRGSARGRLLLLLPEDQHGARSSRRRRARRSPRTADVRPGESGFAPGGRTRR